VTAKLVLLLRLLLGAVFLYAAYTKLRLPWMIFAMSIDAYGVLPEWGVLAVARTLPWIELALGVLLVSGFRLPYASTAATAMLSLFFLLMVFAYGKGSGIDCGCFGPGEALTGKTLARDGLLAALSGTLTALSYRR